MGQLTKGWLNHGGNMFKLLIISVLLGLQIGGSGVSAKGRSALWILAPLEKARNFGIMDESGGFRKDTRPSPNLPGCSRLPVIPHE